MKRKISIFIIIMLAIILTGCKKEEKETLEETNEPKESIGNVTITAEEYKEITIGMTYEEVLEIVGGNCTKSTEKEATYTCSGKLAGTSATFTFQNGELISKEQKGLE